MPKRRLILLLLAGGMLAVAAVITVTSPREPSYQGRALSAWMAGYAQDVEDKSNQETDVSLGAVTPSEDAIRHIGTNALPYLLKWIAYEAPSWVDGLDKAMGKWDKLPDCLRDRVWRFTHAKDTRSDQAVAAFAALGPQAKSAIPELRRRLVTSQDDCAGRALALIGAEGLPALMVAQTNQDPSLRAFATIYIRTMGSNALPALPTLVGYLHDPDLMVAASAAYSLGVLHLDPALAVPALTASLQHSEALVRRFAADALHDFGREALPAVAGLLQACNDADEMVRCTATNALQSIAPEALTNAAPK